jgi:hypothetical protein
MIRPFRLDIGCGPKLAGPEWTGVDCQKFDGVKIICRLGRDKLPLEADCVDEARASHFVEHLDADERIFFFNDLYRVLKPGATFEMTCPYYTSPRAYGDPTHKWPPISEYMLLYLNKEWRDQLAPHVPYTCNFNATWAFLHHDNLPGSPIGDIQATLTKL